jgi:hypothetical protein
MFGLDDCADEAKVRLSKVLPRAGTAMHYVYDLGDWWEHQITLEQIIEDGDATGPTCITGQGDAPVEDWSPDCGQEPARFHIDAINRGLASPAYV